MQSYIGVLARERVKITYDDWRDVPDEVKIQIWESVKMLFIVPESWKEKCFKSACSKWRQFKSKLYKTYISEKMESSASSELNTPPPEYPFIQASDWSEFLFKRLSNSFKKLSKVQKSRRSKIIYHYCLARKGYTKYASEHPELISDDPDADQSMLWVAARKDKDGNFPSETPGLDDTAAKIDELISDKK